MAPAEHGPLRREELYRRVRGRGWGPGRFDDERRAPGGRYESAHEGHAGDGGNGS